MENHVIIKELESDNSRLFKEKIILREMEKNNVIFFEALNFACNKLITFGIKQVPLSKENGPGLSWIKFKEIIIKFYNREITGNNAKVKIESMITLSKKDEWNFFYRRIIIKDLRCGLSEKTINNVAKKNDYKKFLIPVFSCQLAQDSEQHKKKLFGKKIIENKLDGVRVITILHKNGKVDMFSRNGKELLNFEKIKNELFKAINQKKLKQSIVLDGEVVSKNFQDLMKQIYRKDNIQNDDANLFLFDFINLIDFENGISQIKQTQRSINLKNWYNENYFFFSKIKLLESSIINLSDESGKKEYYKFNKKAVLDGYEGIMIKNPEAYYECKRTFHWLKLKPVLEISLSVVSVEEGSGRNEGKLGAIIAQGIDEGKNFKISVGSGFSDNQRIQFWRQKENLIGKIIEIKADAITKSQTGKFWSLRFPRFKTFRGFNDNEKI